MVKHYYDPIYGQIVVDEMYYPIVNSYYFRRLRHLRQLGLCYLSFPGGNHTRYEHSLGAFHLSTLVEKVIEKCRDIDDFNKSRLIALLKLGTLCHDIGHGPFSHMIENALHGEGVKITHEEVGAAIVGHYLEDELKPFSDKFQITPKMICRLMTKTVKDDPLLKCAEELVSSDVDLDRIDYLHRDSHYCGKHAGNNLQQINFEEIWKLSYYHGIPRFELTSEGINFAEEILILRKNNYRRIVFESKHMGLTAMFEKAVQLAAETDNSEFGKRCKIIKEIKMDWADTSSVKNNFSKIWDVYGLYDYQAFNLLEECSNLNVKTIIRKIRIGDCYLSVSRFSWKQIHYVTKKIILSLKNGNEAYSLRRKIEVELSRYINQVDPYQIAIHLQKYNTPKPIISGTISGDLLEEISGLSRFLIDDVKSQYAIELFLDPLISQEHQKEIINNFEEMMCQGKINF